MFPPPGGNLRCRHPSSVLNFDDAAWLGGFFPKQRMALRLWSWHLWWVIVVTFLDNANSNTEPQSLKHPSATNNGPTYRQLLDEVAGLRTRVGALETQITRQTTQNNNQYAKCLAEVDELKQQVSKSNRQFAQLLGRSNDSLAVANPVAPTPFQIHKNVEAYVEKYHSHQYPQVCHDKKFLIFKPGGGGLGAQIHSMAHWACTAMAHERILIQVSRHCGMRPNTSSRHLLLHVMYLYYCAGSSVCMSLCQLYLDLLYLTWQNSLLFRLLISGPV